MFFYVCLSHFGMQFVHWHNVCQGSAHTGREWSAPTTTQLFLRPLELKMAYFYHHSEKIIVLKCYIQCNIIPFSLQLSHHSDHSGQNPDISCCTINFVAILCVFRCLVASYLSAFMSYINFIMSNLFGNLYEVISVTC